VYPEVENIVSLDMYRDGGSLGVTFLDTKHTKHAMIFRIDSAASERSDGMLIYRSALIESSINADWVNRVTCVPASGTVVRKTPITWERAADLLADLRPLLGKFGSDENQVFQKMEQVVNARR